MTLSVYIASYGGCWYHATGTWSDIYQLFNTSRVGELEVYDIALLRNAKGDIIHRKTCLNPYDTKRALEHGTFKQEN